ncbi:MAG: type II toxin-antitoxin system death-on-curing family toxin [Bacteroidetes bacterium]|nr:type II toxin-antitoxin system death-on-curing family toxin [Bacteroidota bacterium]
MENKGEILIYESIDHQTQVEVTFEAETVWLSQKQMSLLFNKNLMTINEHIKNIYQEGELDENPTIREFRIVQIEGKRPVTRKVLFYNLDIIISVGYRVKSKQGTQFRQWATQRLKDYLMKGYALNQKRLDELGRMIQLIEQSGKTETLQLNEAKGLLEILGNYTKSFVLLNQYDSQNLQTGKLSEDITYEIKCDEAKTAIVELKKQLIAKKEATELFGKEKDESFQSSLLSIVQTFDGQYLYPSIEEQAAHLLYFVVKNHSFSDGNKRIGAFLFVWFLEKNKHRFKSSGELKINDNGLTAITLLVAQSKPDEKEIIIHLIVALIADSK